MHRSAIERVLVRQPLALGLSIALALASAGVGAERPRFVTDRIGSSMLDPAAGADFTPMKAVPLWPRPTTFDVTVTNCDDAGPGSLRDALAQTPPGSVHSTVDLTQLTCSTISLASGALGISPNAEIVDVVGPPARHVNGKPVPTLAIDGNAADRVFVNVYPQIRLNLRYIEVQYGEFHGTGTVGASRAAGGCIYSAGILALYESVVSGCVVTGNTAPEGGGIFSGSTTYLFDSAVTNNYAVPYDNGFAYGGGVFSAGAARIEGSLIFNNKAEGASYGGGLAAVGNIALGYSTIAYNYAAYGAGLSLFPNSVSSSIYESTITGNQSYGGGGIESWQTLFMLGNTIASNAATASPLSGGIELVSNASLYLANTIVANNQGGDIGGSGVVIGHNNIVIASTLPVPADTIALDPQLEALADNGGFMPTMALSPDSPAIDAGACTAATGQTDERSVQFDDMGFIIGHFQRVVGPCQDIGAFEYGAGDIFENGFD